MPLEHPILENFEIIKLTLFSIWERKALYEGHQHNNKEKAINRQKVSLL